MEKEKHLAKVLKVLEILVADKKLKKKGNKMDEIDKQNILLIILIIVASIFVSYLISQPISQSKIEIIKDDKIEMIEYNKILLENKKLIKENKDLGEWNIECHDYWEDRYNMRSERDYEELLVYVDYYVRQENIIEGMLDDENLIKNKESWRIDYANLYKDFCFGCDGIDKLRHEFLLKEVENQPGCNNCY